MKILSVNKSGITINNPKMLKIYFKKTKLIYQENLINVKDDKVYYPMQTSVVFGSLHEAYPSPPGGF